MTYGFKARGPLDLLYAGWVSDCFSEIDVSSWVVNLQSRLKVLHDECYLRNNKCKDKVGD